MVNDDIAIDPVCLMRLKKDEAHGTSQYKGDTYYFCSLLCKGRFDKEFDKDRIIERARGRGARNTP